jgi:hypothetical protein
METTTTNQWTIDIESILEKIRTNSIQLSKAHKSRYFYLKHILLYFRMPIIVISGFSSIISVGFQAYIPQPQISIITCLLSLLCSIIGSIELYLAIQTQMESELISSKDFYLLSIDIFKMLALDPINRPIEGPNYLADKYKDYCEFFKKSNTISKRMNDTLLEIDKNATLSNTVSSRSLFVSKKSNMSNISNISHQSPRQIEDNHSELAEADLENNKEENQV